MKRLLAVVCAFALLALCVPFAAMTASAATAQTYTFSTLAGYYKTQGRVEIVDTALNMDTSSSGFEFYFKGSGDVLMGADIKCTYTNNMFLTVIVDGVKSRVELKAAAVNKAEYQSVTLAKGLSDGYHHIEVYKQTEASSALMTVWGVTFAGTPVVAPPADKITIEVVGDSISGGASNLATNSTANASYPVYQDGTQTYAYLTGEALGANVRVTQTSGFGCCGGWNSQGKDLNLQDMYPYTSYWRDHQATGLYDFAVPADIVVINLGTNDASAASYGKISLTDAEFKAGAKNLMTMAKQKNNGAKVVWVTGMMGVTYQSVLTSLVAELGGASAGYYFHILPEGTSGGEGHPNVAQHQAAATELTKFLLENVLPANYKADFATAAELQATVDKATSSVCPSEALKEATAMAQMELACGTTDGYRLGVRNKALKDALNGYTTGLDLMPVEGVTATPTVNGHFVWPYYAVAGQVTLYKGGAGVYWPYVHTDYETVVDLDVTPYLTLETESTAEWNVHIAFNDKNGNRQTVTATDAAKTGLVNFTVNPARSTITVDFGAYIKSLGYADSEGRITVVGCDLYVVGEADTYVKFLTCAFTDNDGQGNDEEQLPSKLEGEYAIENGIIGGVAVGMTADELCAAMNDCDCLRVINKKGETVTGALATGMKLQLVINDEVVDEAVVAVIGDIDGNGTATTADGRLILSYALGASAEFTAVQLIAADADGSGAVSTSDVRVMLQAMVN